MNTYNIGYTPLGEMAILALDHVPYGIAIITETMRVILHNDRAGTIFSDDDGIKLSGGSLELLHWGQEDFQCRISADLAQRTDESSVRVIAISVERPSGRRTYHMLFRPLSQESDDAISGHHGVWIVSIHDPERPVELPRQILRDCYRLTDAEIEVCRLLFIQGRIDSVCAELGLSRNTVKTHLTRIYSKCGVHSQAMLITRLGLALVR